MDEFQIIELFCLVDDFSKQFNELCTREKIEYKKQRIRKRSSRMSMSEVMTILLLFHRSHYRYFKYFYLRELKATLKAFFPKSVSYSRFIRLVAEVFFPMFCFIQKYQGICQGIGFLDSTVLTSCHIRRAASHRVFKNAAKWGKTTTGWFFGFKLHLVINHQAEIISFRLTPGNMDDRKPVPDMLKNMQGKVFADRGYISTKLRKSLQEKGVQLITRLKKNMKNHLIPLWDKLMLRKRALIESVHNLLKNDCQIEHHRHRNRWNFLSNLLSGLAAYCLRRDKPRLYFSKKELEQIQLLSH